MEDIVYFNSEFINRKQIAILPSNRSFRYGDGLFESILITDGEALFLSRHLQRLLKGMYLLKIIQPPHWTQHFFKHLITELLERNKFEFARCRLTVWRDGAGLYGPEINMPGLLVEMHPYHRNNFELNTEGLHLGVFTGMPKLKHPISACKTANSLPYVLAALFAAEQKLDDVVVLNQEGNIADAISSNIFMVKNDVLFTTKAGEGGVEGIMQKVIVDLCKKNGFQVTETILNIANLEDADEIFLSNAIQGVRWVMQFREKQFNNLFATNLVRLINEAKNNHTLVSS